MKNLIAKKSLGQHFLISERVTRNMAREAGIKKGDTVVEVGPGKGILTRSLLDSGAKVIAFEKDEKLAPLLQEVFKKEIGAGDLTLIFTDILSLEDLKEGEIEKMFGKEYALVANIPYYITGAILSLFLSLHKKPAKIVLLVQKEVAKRIVATDNKESILSLSVKSYGKPKILEIVKKTLFRPIPKVDSAILIIDNISEDFFEKERITEKEFFKIIKAGFSHPRKFLKGNLNCPSKTLTSCDISEKARAEDLSLSNWACIVRIFQNQTTSPGQ